MTKHIEHEGPSDENTVQGVAKKALHIYGRQVHLAKSVDNLGADEAALQALAVVLDYLREKTEEEAPVRREARSMMTVVDQIEEAVAKRRYGWKRVAFWLEVTDGKRKRMLGPVHQAADVATLWEQVGRPHTVLIGDYQNGNDTTDVMPYRAGFLEARPNTEQVVYS